MGELGAVRLGGFTGERQGLSQGMHTFVGATLSVCELLSVVDAKPFALRPRVVALPLEFLAEGRQGFFFGFHRVLRGRSFSARGGEIGTEDRCFGRRLLRGLAR